MSLTVPLILVGNIPAFTDKEIIQIECGYFRANSSLPKGVFLTTALTEGDPCIFLTKDELKELIKIIEEAN